MVLKSPNVLIITIKMKMLTIVKRQGLSEFLKSFKTPHIFGNVKTHESKKN